ncbi:Uncharacterised protein [Segatella copri]|nr:Uncharacterised protein [Segatella copri]
MSVLYVFLPQVAFDSLFHGKEFFGSECSVLYIHANGIPAALDF